MITMCIADTPEFSLIMDHAPENPAALSTGRTIVSSAAAVGGRPLGNLHEAVAARHRHGPKLRLVAGARHRLLLLPLVRVVEVVLLGPWLEDVEDVLETAVNDVRLAIGGEG
jgi:hypothetical protein